MTYSATNARLRRSIRIFVVLLVGLGSPLASTRGYAAEPSKAAVENGLSPILHYISSGWDTLTRSMTDCETVVDPKLIETSVLYLPADFPAPALFRTCEALQGPGAVPARSHHRTRTDRSGQDRSRSCCIWKTSTWFPAADSTKCTAGTAISSSLDWCGRTHRSGPGHGGQLLFRDRTLRHHPQCQSRLLPHALATAISDLHDHGCVRADKAAGHENRELAGKGIRLTPVKTMKPGTGSPTSGRNHRAFTLLRFWQRSGTREFERRSWSPSQGGELFSAAS